MIYTGMVKELKRIFYIITNNKMDKPYWEWIPDIIIEQIKDKFVKRELMFLREENKKLKEQLILTENDRDEWKLKAEDYKKLFLSNNS